MSIVPRDFFNMKEGLNSNAQERYQSHPLDHVINLTVADENGEVELSRDYLPSTVTEKLVLLLKPVLVPNDEESDSDGSLSGYID